MVAGNLVKIAKEIINSNIYLTLGTTDGDLPWVAPLFYAVTDDYDFYFISQVSSLHVQNLLKYPKVSFAIFDSHQKEGTGNGVQGLGRAYLLPEDEIEEALNWYHTTFIPMAKKSFVGEAPYRLFKIVTEYFYILDPDSPTDRRVEVALK